MSGLLGPKGQHRVDKRLNAIQITRAAYGNPIPLAYGKVRLAGTLVWYDNFKATPHTQKQGGKGGGGGSSTSYSYSAALLMALCEGPIASVPQVFVDKGVEANIANQNLTLFLGSSGQAVWSFLSSNYPSQAIPYDLTAYVASGNYEMGNSAALPNLTFETVALLSDAAVGGDAHPAAIVADYCTHASHGAAFPYLAVLTGANSYDDYCRSMGFFLSPEEMTQRSARDFLEEIFKVTNSVPVWRASGELAVVPLCDEAIAGNGRTFTPGNGAGGSITTPIYTFTNDDYQDTGDGNVVRVKRKRPSELFNHVRVEYLNRANQYNVDVAEATDANDIALNGERVAPTFTFHCIKSAAVARQVAQLILQRLLYYRNSYQFTVSAVYSLLEPGLDVVSVVDTTIDLVAPLCRVTEVVDDQNDRVTITAEELPIGPGNAPQYAWAGAAGYAANALADPGPVATPLIFTMPPLLVPGGSGCEMAIAVAGTTGAWGGCDVFMSYDNVTYFQVGTVTGPARYGTLRSSLASLFAGDPDTVNVVATQLIATTLDIASTTTTACDNLRALIFVDGEIIAYRDSALVGVGQFDISYLHRGVYGTKKATHAAGSQWAVIDQGLFRVPFDPGMQGKTVYFKFPSFNVYGRKYQDISTVTAYSRIIGSAEQPINAAFSASAINVSQIGSSYIKTGGGVGTWDSQIYSNEGYAGGAYCSAQAFTTTGQKMLGLNVDPATNADYTSIDYAWYCYGGGGLEIYESGGPAGSFGTYTTDTVLAIVADGASVRYLKDGVVVRTVAASPAKLYLDTSFATIGDGWKALAFGPSGKAGTDGSDGVDGLDGVDGADGRTLIPRGQCVVSGANVAKQGGGAAWDSDCYSVAGFTTCHLQFKANSATLNFMAGLNTDPVTDQSYTSMDHAWYCTNAGTLERYQGGSGIATHGTYNSETLLGFKYDGTTVSYMKDGVVVATVTDAGKTFYFDSSFYNPGAGINSIDFGPTTTLGVVSTVQLGDGAATEVVVVTDDSEGISNATPHAYCSVAHAALTYDARVVITAVTSAVVARTSAGLVNFYAKIIDTNDASSEENNAGSPSPIIGNSYVQQDVNLVTGALTANLAMAVEKSYLVPAGSPMNYSLCVEAIGINTTSAMFNTKVKMEIIKR